MKISLNWLKSYVPVLWDVHRLADALTMVGLEVEGVYDRYDYLKTVVVGRVVSVSQHPNAARLKCCMVDSGNGLVPVVCGAPNVHVNCLSALALPGTNLPGGNVIEIGVIRGEISSGMLCSEAELELGPDRSGIMILDESLTPGECLASALKQLDTVLEIGLTPNRADCLSFIGIAREAAAIQNASLHFPEIQLPENGDDIRQMTSVDIQAPDHCPRYSARVVSHITIGPSPFWLRDRLISVGIRPVNNVVDITNFVMMETGQPLHAFDLDLLADRRIIVRRAASGESFVTLDHKTRTLKDDMLMICDGEKPVAIAGVMGGCNSEIGPDTRTVLIESACFNPVSIRKTSKYFGLNTDASHRFERGVDPEGTLFALDRAAALMVEICGGICSRGYIDEYPGASDRTPILLSAEAVNRLLGTSLDVRNMDELLQSIGFEVKSVSADLREVLPPSFRVDVSRSVDLVEEIARLSGYAHIPTTFPIIPESVPTGLRHRNCKRQLLELMTGFGFSEAITYSFVHPRACRHLRLKSDDIHMRTLEILNPLTEDQGVMRTSLIPGLLDTVYYNITQQSRNLKLFEIGNVFISNGQNALPDETEMLACVWTGARHDISWHAADTACDFYDLKGVAEALLKALHVHQPVFTRITDMSRPYLKMGYAAHILCDDRMIGCVGQIHPETLAAFGVKQPVYGAEINIQRLFAEIPEVRHAMAIPRFPSVSRDVTLIISRSIESMQILQAVRKMNEPLVEQALLFAVFEGGRLPSGKKSVSFRLIYRSLEETLEDGVVNDLHTTISDRLIRKFDALLP